MNSIDFNTCSQFSVIKENSNSSQPIINIETNSTKAEFKAFQVKYPDYEFHDAIFQDWNFLCLAAVKGNVELISYGVKKGGNKLLSIGSGVFGWVPLFCAVNCEDKKQAILSTAKLIELGSPINVGTATKLNDDYPAFATPLWKAIHSGKKEIAQLLLNYKGIILPETPLNEADNDFLKSNEKTVNTWNLILRGNFNEQSLFHNLPKDVVRTIHNLYQA